MLRIENTKVYGLEESVVACRNAMRIDMPEYTEEEFARSMGRAQALVHSSAVSDVKCHDNFLTGIIVQADIVYPQYIALEMQRYHFLQIVTSSSKMHRLAKMDMDRACNEYVCDDVKNLMRGYINLYNAQPTYEHFMAMMANCPMGLELFMRISTNYKQLQTIYRQRRSHRLKEWHTVCEWIEGLPYFDELIIHDKNA